MSQAKSWLPSYRHETQISRRRFLKGAAAGAGAVALIACGGGSDDGGLKLDDSGSSREPGTEALDVYSELKDIYIQVRPKKL